MEDGVVVPIGGTGLEGLFIEAFIVNPEQDVAYEILDLDNFAASIGRVAATFGEALKSARPDKVTIELSVTAGIESGKLVAILGKVTGSSTLKMVLEWSKDSDSPVVRSE